MGSGQAVFLSYASEDAEAAQRICAALRVAGLEAWFDQSELRGGDAWDQKIRRQIKDCAIFMPLISATTNSRAEGYFRLEWKLGVDRSHLMADDAPFIVPVAIDATPEAEARVPDRFREVQWMRLGKHSPEEIAARVKKLLSGEATPATRTGGPRRARLRMGHVWGFVGIAIFLFFVTRPMWHTKQPTESAAVAPAAEKVSEAAQLAGRALEPLKKLNYTRETLATSADLARKASELDPALALAWGARARVEATWLHRNWDLGEARRRTARDYARRALAIDPEEPHALWSQGMVLRFQGAFPEAEAMFKRGLKRSPDNEMRRALAAIYRSQRRDEEAIAAYEDAIRHDPLDPLAHFSLSLVHASTFTLRKEPDSVDKALAHLDRSLEIAPTGHALVQKAVILAMRKGDFDGARDTLARVTALPHEESTDDRVIYARMWIALLDRKPAQALKVAALTTSTYFTDAVVSAPVAWLKALAHHLAGRESAAAEEWRAAEVVLRTRLAAAPDSLSTQGELAVTLAMLGRKEEATKQFARYDATMREQRRLGTILQVRFHSAMGDGKRAAEAIKAARETGSGWVTDPILARDPWFDRVRGKPEFKALLG